LADIILLDALTGSAPNRIENSATPGRMDEPENWYSEPFTKRTACKTPGQCGGDCNCGCPYNTMTEIERLPLIEEIAALFPNEWLGFIISAAEDDDYEPLHGKLVAHSPDPDEVYDAVNTVLWNQHVYVFFNGDFETMQASYGARWDEAPASLTQRTYSGPKDINAVAAAPAQDPLPASLIDLIYSAIDKLYGAPDLGASDLGTPNLNEAIRRLRLARVRAAAADDPLVTLLDQALDQIEGPLPRLNEIIWLIEEGLAELNIA